MTFCIAYGHFLAWAAVAPSGCLFVVVVVDVVDVVDVAMLSICSC